MPQDKIRSADITITSGTTTAEIDLKGRVLIGLFTPSGISSTALNISAAPASGGTFVNIQDGLSQYGAAGDISFTIVASKYLSIPAAITAGLSSIKLVFGSSETSKTFTYVTREI